LRTPLCIISRKPLYAKTLKNKRAISSRNKIKLISVSIREVERTF
jgi:hypothetical protein